MESSPSSRRAAIDPACPEACDRYQPGGGCEGDQTFGSKLRGAQWAVAEFLAKVPDDYQRKQTMANAERFITPGLKEVENKVLGADERAIAHTPRTCGSWLNSAGRLG